MAAAPPSKEGIEQPSLGRVLVIGGCGFLGHHVVRLLLRDWKCAAVSVVDLRCARNRRPASDGVEYVEADITDGEALAAAFQTLRPDVVIHTASPPAQGSGAVADSLFQKVNVEGTRAVVAACRASGAKALVYTSSASVLSDNKSDLINANEDYPVIRGPAQTEYYSETKAEAEELVLAANRTEPYDLLTTAIRPSGIFGEGDVQVAYHAVNLYREGRDKVQVGENTNLFDFTYVENVAHAHLLAARALLVTHAAKTAPLDHEKVDGEAFLVTNDQPVYFWDMMRAIWAAAGSQKGPGSAWVLGRELGIVLGFLSEVVFGLLRKPPTLNRQRIVYSCMTRYYDISKAKRRLGYKPLVSLGEGVRRAVRWTLEQEKK
ncbi:erg26, C-3 sterol dehydrogenase [Diatrype stigma]|uniref:Sterol-4-alpha-carboxylate 3-dehydrogenase ERG26, decarboxylating n=1 Tax=Diatrype stigma TaxID=117547 RepID=A0AAN9UU04_9PEZI